MMNDILIWILALLAGAGLGAFFFGGLWWTVQKGPSSRQPALLFLGSMLLRSGVALSGFYFVADSRWERMAACLLGFIIMRAVITRLTRPLAETA
ncbi:MAG: hypothetical protein KDD01_08400 [Phaeodactylibacter sp.]|nr:hypothetical protein [Phaeodactylibacter sp.]